MLITTARAVAELLPRRLRAAWISLAALTAVNALAEAVGAAAIFALIQVITAPAVVRGDGLLPQLYELSGVSDTSNFVLVLAFSLAIFYVAKNALLLLEVYVQNRLVNAAAARTSADLLARHVASPHEFRTTRTSAEIIRNFSVSTDTVFRTVMLALTGLITEAAIALGVLTVLVVVSPVATLLVAAMLGGGLAVFYRLFRSRYTVWGRSVQDASQSVLRLLQETLGSVKELVVLGREGVFVRRYANQRYELGRTYARYGTLVQAPRFALETLFIFAVVGVVVLTSFSASAEQRVVPQLGLYAYAGFRLLPTMNRLLTHLSNIRFGGAAVDDVVAQARSLEMWRLETPQTLPSQVVIRRRVLVNDVSFTYTGAASPSLCSVNLEVASGEVVGIVGPTGAGKSTLVDVVMGLLQPTAGEVLVDDAPWPDVRAWQRSIGYVPQSPYLLDDTLRRNIALGVPDEEIDEARISAAVAAAQLASVVTELPSGLDTRLGEGGGRLSGGQRQRVAIARALYPDPSMLVLDEATSALDNSTELEIAKAIRTLRGRQTIIVVAHRVASMRGCDRLVYLESGCVLAVGSFDDLAENCEAFRQTVLAT